MNKNPPPYLKKIWIGTTCGKGRRSQVIINTVGGGFNDLNKTPPPTLKNLNVKTITTPFRRESYFHPLRNKPNLGYNFYGEKIEGGL